MSEERRNECDEASIDEDGDMSEYFKEVGTQVEESDIVADAVQTGVAETPHAIYTQVFGTARLSTEPQTTFVLPSLQSAFGHRTSITEATTPSDGNTAITSTAGSESTVLGDDTQIRNVLFTENSRSDRLHHNPPSSRPTSSCSPVRTASNNQHQSPTFRSHPYVQPGGATRLTKISSRKENTAVSTEPNWAPPASHVVSGTSSQVHRRSILSSHPAFLVTRPSVQSDVLIARATTYSGISTASDLPGAPLQTSEKFLHEVSRNTTRTLKSRDVRDPIISQHTSPPRETLCNILQSEASTSRDSVQFETNEPHPLQLTGEGPAHNDSDCSTTASENPLTRRRVSSAPSVGLGYFGRLYKRALLTDSSPEQVDVGLPCKSRRLETSHTAVQTGEMELERKQHDVSYRRRRSSVETGKTRKRRKSVAFMDQQDERDPRLRDKLHQRVWDGTTFKVEEVDDIDFTEVALSRRGSRRESMGIIGNVGHPFQEKRRRHSTAVHNARRSIAEEVGDSQTRSSTSADVELPVKQSFEQDKSGQSVAESADTSNQTYFDRGDMRSAEESAGEASHAYWDSAESEGCSTSSSGKQNREDDSEINDNFLYG